MELREVFDMGMDIEKLATSAVEDAISKTDYITPYINSADKQPFWDGYLCAYSDSSKKNEFFIGKVSVQVKGKSCKEFAKNEYKYLVKVTDLKSFNIEGGTIYFVVQINESGDKKIFYNALLPFELNKMLSRAGKKNKMTIKVYEFPTDKTEIANIILNFVRDKDKQVLIGNGENISLKDLVEQVGINNCSFSFSYTNVGSDTKKPYEYLFNHDVYLYAECKKLNIKVPIDHMGRAQICMTNLEGNVMVGGIPFYKEYRVAHMTDRDEIYIGKSFVIVYANDKENAKLSYRLRGNLNERIVAEEMLIKLAEEKYIYINNVQLEINLSQDELMELKLNEAKKHLAYLRDVKETLEYYGVYEPLKCERMTEKEEKYIKMMILSYKYNEMVSFNGAKVLPVSYIQVENLKILLFFEEHGDGKYLVRNFDDTKLKFWGEYKDGNKFRTSKYTILQAEDFATISNLNFDIIVDGLKDINNQGHIIRTKLTLLEMLKAYDKNRNSRLLDSACRLAYWIKEVDENVISTINLFQCYYRKRVLTDDEEIILEELLISHRTDKKICLAAYILLGKSDRAKKLFEDFSEEDKINYMNLPIYTLLSEK